MNELLRLVKQFHDVYSISSRESFGLIPLDTARLRHALMEEENNEYLEACKEEDLVEIADALGDKLYVLCGTIIAHGLQDKIVKICEEIHRSNMSKLDPCPFDTDGDGDCGHSHCNQFHRKVLKREDGKVLKGSLYFKPNIKSILDETNNNGA